MQSGSQQVNRNKQKRRIRLVLFVMLCFSVWTGYTLFMQSRDLAEKEQQLNELQQEAQKVKQKQNELTYKASRLNDKEYIAELARKNLFMSKPGEIIYVLPEK